MRFMQSLLILAAVLLGFLLIESFQAVAQTRLAAVLQSAGLDPLRHPLAVWGDRLRYGLVAGGLGALIFQVLLPFRGDTNHPHANRDAFWLRGSAVVAPGWGLAGGVLLFGMMFGIERLLQGLGLAAVPTRETLAAVLREDAQVFLLHLIASAGFTAVFEEFFFRGCMQRYLERNGFGPRLSIGYVALLFVLVHPIAAVPVLLPAGLVFGFFFWRQGLLPAILAHASYNALILTAVRYFP